VRIYGVSELARALGVSEDVIRKRRERGTLPAPVEKLTMGYVWQGEAIETYIEQHWPKGETR
jgi:predicted DNA-binding transcriptional regulator AlpA